MTAIDLLGMTADCISAITFLPPLIKTCKTTSATDISLLVFAFAAIFLIMWLVYGPNLQNASLLFANTMVLVFSLAMVYLKFKNGSLQGKRLQKVKEMVTHAD